MKKGRIHLRGRKKGMEGGEEKKEGKEGKEVRKESKDREEQNQAGKEGKWNIIVCGKDRTKPERKKGKKRLLT